MPVGVREDEEEIVHRIFKVVSLGGVGSVMRMHKALCLHFSFILQLAALLQQ